MSYIFDVNNTTGLVSFVHFVSTGNKLGLPELTGKQYIKNWQNQQEMKRWQEQDLLLWSCAYERKKKEVRIQVCKREEDRWKGEQARSRDSEG